MTELEEWLIWISKENMGQGKTAVSYRLREAANELVRLRAENEALKPRTLTLKDKE